MVRVLLCDDTDELRELARWALQRTTGVEVAGEAADEQGAVALAAALAPDVVICDLDMPGVGPAALLRGLREAAPACRIVTFSGYEPTAVAAEAAETVAAHVPKTAGLDALCLTVLEVGS